MRFAGHRQSILDHCCLRVHAHDLVALRLVLGDGRASIDDQLLDQLGARGHVLDQHNAGVEQTLLLTRRAFEVRVLEPLAQHAQQIKVLAFDAPPVRYRAGALGGSANG